MTRIIWNEKLHDRLDQALAADATIALAAHLLPCPACRAQLDALRALRATTQTLARDLKPSRDLWPAIEQEISAAKVKPVWFGSPIVWQFAASLAVFLAVA